MSKEAVRYYPIGVCFQTLLTIAIVVFFASSATAESNLALTPHCGLNLATVTGDVEDEFLGRKAGVMAGLEMWIPLNDRLSVRAGVDYSMKGARWSYERETDSDEPETAVDNSTANYLDIPLNMVFTVPIKKRLQPYLSAGGVFSAFLGAKKSVRIDGEQIYHKSSNRGATNFDLGLRVSAGAGLPVGSRRLLIEIGYTFGILNAATGEEEMIRNSVATATLGFNLRLPTVSTS